VIPREIRPDGGRPRRTPPAALPPRRTSKRSGEGTEGRPHPRCRSRGTPAHAVHVRTCVGLARLRVGEDLVGLVDPLEALVGLVRRFHVRCHCWRAFGRPFLMSASLAPRSTRGCRISRAAWSSARQVYGARPKVRADRPSRRGSALVLGRLLVAPAASAAPMIPEVLRNVAVTIGAREVSQLRVLRVLLADAAAQDDEVRRNHRRGGRGTRNSAGPTGRRQRACAARARRRRTSSSPSLPRT